MTDLNDIRKYFLSPSNTKTPSDRNVTDTPPATVAQTPMQRNWKTNRRIIESDTDENAEQQACIAPFAQIIQQGVCSAGGIAIADTGHAASHANEAPIVINSSDSDNTEQPSMNTAPRRVCNMDAHRRNLDIALHRAAAGRNGHNSPATAQRRRTRRRYEDEAEEATTTTSSSDNSDDWACVESDTDAEDLYRSAIAGVRNARASRQQLRAATTPCAVCAKFAAFIQHFI